MSDRDPATERRPPRARPIACDEVLTVLVDVWRQRAGIDPDVEYEVPLDRSTGVERAANLLGVPTLLDDWATIATVLSYRFAVRINPDEWKAVLQPTRERKLGPVCDLIARHALAPAVERSFGDVDLDWPAAVFRTLLLVMADAGFDISGLNPNSKLGPCVKKHELFFVDVVSRIAPGRLPAIHSANLWLRASVATLATGIGLLLVRGMGWIPLIVAIGPVGWLGWMGVAAGIVGVVVTWRARFAQRRLGELITFGDLCYALASPPPDSAPPCTAPDGGPVYWDYSHHPHHPTLPHAPLTDSRNPR